MSESPHPAVTYGSYLRVEDLLSLQVPRSPGPEHDELLFIVIHQVYELWFKELHRGDLLRLGPAPYLTETQLDRAVEAFAAAVEA